jgi:methyl-accepting chemotaxis protein
LLILNKSKLGENKMMKFFGKLSIRVKLMGGFLVLAVLLVVVGWLGTLAMNAVSARSDKMMANNVQDIQDLHLMKVSLLNVRSEVQRAVLYADAEKTKAAIESIEAYQVENQKNIDSYLSRIESEDVNCTLDSGHDSIE